MSDELPAAQPSPWTPPPGTRPVLVIGRSERGNLLTFELGEPEEHGWYTPTVTEHYEQSLATAAALSEAPGDSLDVQRLLRVLEVLWRAGHTTIRDKTEARFLAREIAREYELLAAAETP